MTEKRFIRNIIGQVYDSENDKFFEEDYGGKPIGYEDDLVVCLNALHEENEELKQQLFEARRDYLIETADISDKPYLDDEIEKERKEIFGDVE